MDFAKLLADINNFVWGPVMLALLVAIGAGLYAFFIAGFKAYDRRRHASR